MESKIYLYPLWVRLWHLFNALFIIGLIATGVSMQYSSLENPLIDFAVAVKMHNICGVLLSINYVIYVLGNIFTGNGRFYVFKLRELYRDMFVQLRFYTYGIFNNEKHPFPVNENQKFNPLQKIAYGVVMFIAVPVLILSGWFLLFPGIMVDQIAGKTGLFVLDLFHVFMGFVVSVFLLIHIYSCTMGSSPTALFKAMKTGWHEADP